ncbi:uncharacterized protein [Dermacentor andersoni]|uniref:uncharacterized protein n=1 Tax=Dermacentor andersoni TaxID=34620 RepID=UPI003B3B59C0
MPRRQTPAVIAVKPTSPAPSATNSGSSPTSPMRNHQPIEVGAPPATSPVSRNGNSRRPQHHHASDSKTTESTSPSNALPPVAAVVASGSRSSTIPRSPSAKVRGQSKNLGTAAFQEGKNAGPRIILPYHLRRRLGDAKTTTLPKKPSVMASSATARKPLEHHSPVLHDEGEGKKREGGKTKPAVDTLQQYSEHGPRGLSPSVVQSSPSTSSFDVARRRASSAQTMLSEEVMERLHSLVNEGAGPKQRSARCRDVPWRAFATCTVAVVFLIAVLAAYFAGRFYSSAQRLGRNSSCNSAGCQLLSSEVINRLNMSVDPCDDIEAHVCGPVRWESDLVTDTATQMMRVWMERGALHLEAKRRPEGASVLME